MRIFGSEAYTPVRVSTYYGQARVRLVHPEDRQPVAMSHKPHPPVSSTEFYDKDAGLTVRFEAKFPQGYIEIAKPHHVMNVALRGFPLQIADTVDSSKARWVPSPRLDELQAMYRVAVNVALGDIPPDFGMSVEDAHSEVNRLSREMAFYQRAHRKGLAQWLGHYRISLKNPPNGLVYPRWDRDDAAEFWAHVPENTRKAVRKIAGGLDYLSIKKAGA